MSIQDTMVNKTDYVNLRLSRAEVCEALQQGMDGGRMCNLSLPVHEAITWLKMWVKSVKHSLDSSLMDALDCRTIMEIQEKVVEKGR